MNYNRLEERYDDFDDVPNKKGGGKKGKISPFEIEELTPIQLANTDMDEFFEGRKQFTKDEWIDVLLRSTSILFFGQSNLPPLIKISMPPPNL